MSLEARIETLTAAVERLTAALQSSTVASSGLGTTNAADTATSTGKRTRKAAADKAGDTSAGSSAESGTTGTSDTSTSASTTAAGPEVNDGKKVSVKLRAGDPEGTRYFHIAEHRTVAAIKPGEVIPSLPGMSEIGGDEYDTLKAQYSPPVQSAETTANAAAPAATPSASPASSASPATAPAVDGPKLMEACKALHARDGNDGVRKVLEHFKVAKVGDLVGNTSMHAEAFAFVDALLNPKTEAPAANVEADLFG